MRNYDFKVKAENSFQPYFSAFVGITQQGLSGSALTELCLFALHLNSELFPPGALHCSVSTFSYEAVPANDCGVN